MQTPDLLEPILRFVNTHDVETGEEDLDSPAAVRDWFGLDALPSTAEVARAHEVREALRSLLHHNHGLELDPDAVAVLEREAARARLAMLFEDGQARLRPQTGGVDGALGDLLARIPRAQAEGTWTRLKACAAETCQYAYYDGSRNRSGQWCSMKVCGNRAKVRSFRERHAAH